MTNLIPAGIWDVLEQSIVAIPTPTRKFNCKQYYKSRVWNELNEWKKALK